MSFHQITALGRLGQDPELKKLPSGTIVVNVSLVTSEKWTDSQTNERKEKPTWFRLALYGKSAEIFHQYMKKGSQVMVTGTIEARAYMGNDGEPRASLELRVKEFRFIGSNGGGDSHEDSGGNDDISKDIPF